MNFLSQCRRIDPELADQLKAFILKERPDSFRWRWINQQAGCYLAAQPGEVKQNQAEAQARAA